MREHELTGGEIRGTLLVFGQCFPFFTSRDQLGAQQNICCKLRKVFAKNKARVYFKQEKLHLFLGFHETRNLSRENQLILASDWLVQI